MSYDSGSNYEYNRELKNKQKLAGENAVIDGLKKKGLVQEKEVEKDFLFLKRMKEFDLTEKDVKWIKHLINLPEGKGVQFLLNYIQARTGSAIAHYENKFFYGYDLGNFNERNV